MKRETNICTAGYREAERKKREILSSLERDINRYKEISIDRYEDNETERKRDMKRPR